MALSRKAVSCLRPQLTTLMRHQLTARMIATEAPQDLTSDAAVKLLKENSVMVYAKSYCPYVYPQVALLLPKRKNCFSGTVPEHGQSWIQSRQTTPSSTWTKCHVGLVYTCWFLWIHMVTLYRWRKHPGSRGS